MTPTLLLSYQLNPAPAPLMASPANPAVVGYNQSVLTLTASNTTASDVTLKYLRLEVPLGSGAADLLALLTLADLQAAVGVTPDPAWTLLQTSVQTDAAGQVWGHYLFHPTGTGTLPAGNSWTFTWQGVAPTYWGVPINTVPGGPIRCQVVEGSAASPGGAVQPLPLYKAPAGWFAPTLLATPVTVASGGTVQLSWNGPAGASYQLNGLASGAPTPLPNAGTWASAPLTQDPVFVFTLQVDYTPAQAPPQHASPQQTVTVQPPAPAPPVINSFTGTMLDSNGQPTLLLNWNVSPATAIVTLSGNSGKFNASSESTITPSAAQPLRTTYTLTATNPAGQQATSSLTATYQPVQTLPVGSQPWALAHTPGGGQAWVVNRGGNTVTVLDTASCQPVRTLAVGNQPWAIALTPDGRQAWVANNGDNTVTVLDTATYQPLHTLPVGRQPSALAFTPDGRQAWVANAGGCTVMVLDTASYQSLASIPVGQFPTALALTPDGHQAWVANFNDNTVTVLDTASCQPVRTLAVGNQTLAVAFTPGGGQAWVANAAANTVMVLDTATYQTVQTISVGSSPTAIALTPDGGQAWVTNASDNTVKVLALTKYLPSLGDKQ